MEVPEVSYELWQVDTDTYDPPVFDRLFTVLGEESRRVNLTRAQLVNWIERGEHSTDFLSGELQAELETRLEEGWRP